MLQTNVWQFSKLVMNLLELFSLFCKIMIIIFVCINPLPTNPIFCANTVLIQLN